MRQIVEVHKVEPSHDFQPKQRQLYDRFNKKKISNVKSPTITLAAVRRQEKTTRKERRST